MIILGIETSCDETAISLIEFKKPLFGQPKIKILANELISQIKIHEQYGGVFPMMAKREHSQNLVPILLKVLKELDSGNSKSQETKTKQTSNPKLQTLNTPEITNLYSSVLQKTAIDFAKDTILFENIKNNLSRLVKPKKLDAIAVTNGPGLEPCLWTGLNFARALGELWKVPVTPVNHMEGHVLVSLLREQGISNNQFPNSKSEKLLPTHYSLQTPAFPAIALLISGGHTELVLMRDWGKYEIVGQTKDDAVGEAFDKVARVLGLPYPGGPQISALAEIARNPSLPTTHYPLPTISLPRPMLKSGDLNFSFSGLKTAVLYLAQKIGTLSDTDKQQIAREFEDSVVEVLTTKTAKAIEKFGAKSLILGGGVIANKEIRQAFTKLAQEKNLKLFLPQLDHATDNAIMISIAGALNFKHQANQNLSALGNLKLS
ncbi:MAG: tRNA (adenosine(37)-N6)-threonylcarbamoyltransferase complex transferase subunit TsaD [Candidatus Paceibacterota bacterium]